MRAIANGNSAGRAPLRGVAGWLASVAVTPGNLLPPEVMTAARRAILDTVGVGIAGAGETCTKLVSSSVGPGGGPCQLWGTSQRASALDAAMINAIAAHALDYDDVHANVMGHPSAVLVPAALACAELVGASGRDVLAGYVIGLEVGGLVGQMLGPAHPRRGFHSTSTIGALSAAAACSRIAGLDQPSTATALAIAASGAAGLRSNFGTMTKPLHAGNAARSGLLAALLARSGYTASAGALDADGGFLSAYSDRWVPAQGPTDALASCRADGWQILSPGLTVKKYACCNRAHRAADALLALVGKRNVEPGDVASVSVEFPAGQVDDAGRVGPLVYTRPETGLEGKFSLPYIMSAGLVDRALDIGVFTDLNVRRAAIAELLPRVIASSDPGRLAGTELDYVEVTLALRSGERLVRRVRYARGDPRGGTALTDEELCVKYAACAETVLDAVRAARSAVLIGLIEELSHVGELTSALAAS